MTGTSSWKEFLSTWKSVMLAESHHEYEFARRVLRNVPGLAPREVTPQMEFVDQEGRSRRMDFAIVHENLRLAIEVDGWDKTGEGRGMNSAEHADYTARERALVNSGWKVLRFANREIYEDPGALTLQIRDALSPTPSAVPTPRPLEPANDPNRREFYPPADASDSRLSTPQDQGHGSIREERSITTRLVIAALLVAGAAIYLLSTYVFASRPATSTTTSASTTAAPAAPGPDGVAPINIDDCPSDHPVKGNISEDGERIFHLPSGEFYDVTNPEICFANAAEATAAGYRRSRR